MIAGMLDRTLAAHLKEHLAIFAAAALPLLRLRSMDDVPGNPVDGARAVKLERGVVPSPGTTFYTALEDRQPDRSFIVYGGTER